MSAFRIAYQFFKTWFLPQQYDDEEITDSSAPSVHHTQPAQPSKPSVSDEAPAKANAPTPFVEPASDNPTAENTAAASELKESTSQASYAIPPVPAAMQPRADDPPVPAADESSTVNPADDPASFSHLVKPPTAADQRYSRRRMEGTDPSAFE